FLAFELDPRCKAGALATPGILDESEKLDRKRDGLRHAVHCERAGHVVRVFLSRRFDARALEGDLRKFLHFEKVRAAKVFVTIFDAGVDRRALDVELD